MILRQVLSDWPRYQRGSICAQYRIQEFPQLQYWMGGRVVEGTGLENRQARKRLEGSNPSPSARFRQNTVLLGVCRFPPTFQPLSDKAKGSPASQRRQSTLASAMTLRRLPRLRQWRITSAACSPPHPTSRGSMPPSGSARRLRALSLYTVGVANARSRWHQRSKLGRAASPRCRRKPGRTYRAFSFKVGQDESIALA